MNLGTWSLFKSSVDDEYGTPSVNENNVSLSMKELTAKLNAIQRILSYLHLIIQGASKFEVKQEILGRVIVVGT